MKWKSYILLLALIVFLFETFSIPVIAHENSATKMCVMRKAMKTGKKDCCSHEGKAKMNCTDCPLCYLAVSASSPKYFVSGIINKIKFNDFINPVLPGYNNENWKPPNAL